MAPIAEATGHTGLAVCANGAIVYDMGEERILEEFALEPADLQVVVDRLVEAMPDLSFAVERSGILAHEASYIPAWESADVPEILDRSQLFVTPVTKLLVRNPEAVPDPDRFLATARAAVDGLVTMTRSSADELLEISAVGVTKASGLERFARSHGVSPDQVIAFGDMPNDLPMLAWAGHAVAVANAHPDVLAIADEVARSNDDDGVACVLERLFGA
jgi:hydroxymethylpyrimidine pyrophosphatase-like HAD family hydrolase